MGPIKTSLACIRAMAVVTENGADQKWQNTVKLRNISVDSCRRPIGVPVVKGALRHCALNLPAAMYSRQPVPIVLLEPPKLAS